MQEKALGQFLITASLGGTELTHVETRIPGEIV